MRYLNFGTSRPMYNRTPKQAFSKRAIYQRIELYNKKDDKNTISENEEVNNK